MNKHALIGAFLFLLTTMLLSGCAEAINSSVATGINITVSKPMTNDTIYYQGQEVTYALTIDQGIKFIELYINGNYFSTFFPNSSGVKPVVKITLDSSYVNKRITYQLKYYDNDNKSIEGTVYSNILVLDNRLAPNTPFGLTILQITSTSYNLSWKDTSKVEVTYQIWRMASSESDFSLYLSVPSGTFNINDDYVDTNLVYFYKVRGINSYSSSDFSNSVNTIGAGGSTNLLPPRLLTAIATNTTVVKLIWQSLSTMQNYFKIERRSNSGSYVAIGIVSKSTNNYTDSSNGLFGGGVYWYRIKAISGTDSSWSNEISVTTPIMVIPAPQIISITNPSTGKVTINFIVNNDPWVDYSLIERKTGSGGTWAQIDHIATWIVSYDDATVQIGNTYYFRIRKYSVNTQLYSDYSNEMSIYVNL